MSTVDTNSNASNFQGSIPQLYQRYLVPLIFDPYAMDLCQRVVELKPNTVLELAAGTGAVTRLLAMRLSRVASIVGTDLSQPMLDEAIKIGTARTVEWLQADAMQLPFTDKSFDLILCQFGVMFFPDKIRAFKEVKRVLRQCGHFIFNVWDQVEKNELISTVLGAIDILFPNDPPRFMQNCPHSYADNQTIARDLTSASLHISKIIPVSYLSRAAMPWELAIGFCQGSPLRSEIEAKGVWALERATAAAAAALETRFGRGPIEGRMQAYIVVAHA
jgi:ubiquinone/menaquinone biosynthesis C-methylase UbiE